MLAVDLFDVFELFALFPPTWVYLKRIGSHAYGKYVWWAYELYMKVFLSSLSKSFQSPRWKQKLPW